MTNWNDYQPLSCYLERESEEDRGEKKREAVEKERGESIPEEMHDE